MVNYRVISTAFIVLTIVFASFSAYLVASPNTLTSTQTSTLSVILTTTVGSQSGSQTYSVNIGYKPTLGFYLTNGTGRTLYFFKEDIPANGTSACNGGCATKWPPFYANNSNLILPAGLNATSFGIITRGDGNRQTTYNGSPLYYYAPDNKTGDTTGQGVGGVWYAWTLPTPSGIASSSSSLSTTASTSCYYGVGCTHGSQSTTTSQSNTTHT